MQEAAPQVTTYLLGNPLLSLALALLAGFAAAKTVTLGTRLNIFVAVVAGVAGLFLGQFMLVVFGLLQYIDSIPEFRLLFDFIAAYVGSFVVATVIHFVKPI
jgi:uncharacterized membrane protein YeaQ/YmgE (transglycosylase-associated protein family)